MLKNFIRGAAKKPAEWACFLEPAIDVISEGLVQRGHGQRYVDVSLVTPVEDFSLEGEG